MSFENITPAPGMYDWLPVEYKDLVDYGPYKDPDKRPKVSDMGKFKEIMEEHPMCAGCAMTLFISCLLYTSPSPRD